MMERTVYQRVREVFFAAAALEGEAAAQYVDEACGSDAQLRAEVERLLHGSVRLSSGALLGAVAEEAGEADLAPLPPDDPSSVDDPGGAFDIPETLGGYRIEEELGRGGMGVVVRAFDPWLERRVALKVLHGGVRKDLREALQQEARVMATLSHPHIATVHALEEADGVAFVVMELVEGRTLADQLAHGPLPVAETLRIAHQLAQALEVAHGRGFLHLDLKPANLMLTHEGRLKVLDFGLARSREAHGATAIAGTPGYMSPEQLDGEGVDARSDLWAIGCILYECLTGTKAIAGDSVLATVMETLHGSVDRSALPTRTPSRLGDLIEQCLDREPSRRLSSAGELRRAVDACVLAEQVPEAKSPATIRPRLPRVLSSILGRDELLEQVLRDLQATPLVTLTGFGGCGKTRLALEVIRRVVDGADPPPTVWIELGALDDPEALWPTLAGALEVKSTAKDIAPLVLARVRELRPLLVLDNCEHLITEVAEVIEALLADCPETRVLATSREELGLPWERRVDVPPLTPRDGQGDPALQLLLARASSHGTTIPPEELPLARDLVRRLDGIPLAIELVAGRLQMLSLEALLERLDVGHPLPQSRDRTAPARHRTLEATLEWSYQLLTPAEQRLLARLSLFADGWTLQGAEKVCAGGHLESWEILDTLGALLSKSLVTVSPGFGNSGAVTRYRLLETVRQFARAKLDASGDEAAVRTRFVATMVEFATEAAARMRGRELPRWLERIDAAHANIVAAIEAALTQGDNPSAALEGCEAMWHYWEFRGLHTLGIRLLRRALDRADAGTPTETVARAHNALGILARNVGDYDLARPHQELALKLAREVGARPFIATALLHHGILLKSQGDHDQALANYAEAAAMFRELDDPLQLASTLVNLATLRRERGEVVEARRHYEDGLALAREHHEARAEAAHLGGLGTLHLDLGDPERAEAHYRQAVEIHRGLGNRRALASSLGNLGLATFLQERHEESIACHEESLAIRRELGDRRGEAIVLLNLVSHGMRLGQPERARAWLRRAFEWVREARTPRFLAYTLEAGASILHEEGASPDAGKLYGAAEALRERARLPLSEAEAAERAEWVEQMMAAPGATQARSQGRALDREQAISLLGTTLS